MYYAPERLCHVYVAKGYERGASNPTSAKRP